MTAPHSKDAERPRRKAPRAIRQRQIVEATIDAINKVGFAETTLAHVARLAGVSQASLVFHFKTKDALLVETLRHLAEEYRATWHRALDAAPAGDPLARICALVAADFEPALTTRRKVAVWHAFWGEAKSRPTYMRICGERDEERAAVMERECAALLAELGRDPAEAPDVAAAIDGLCDGLWQRLLMEHRTFGRADGLRIMFFQLRTQFPERAAEIAAQAERPGRRKAGSARRGP